MRDIFSSKISSPHGAPIESRGGTGQINEQGASITPTRQEDGSSKLTAAHRQPGEHSFSSKGNDLLSNHTTKHSDSDTRTEPSESIDSTDTSRHLPDFASGMGRMATSQEQSRLINEAVSTHTTTEVEEEESEPGEEFKIHGQSVRPGRLPTLRPRRHRHDLHLNELDGASTLMNDQEADSFGPLTEAALNQERQRSQLDPSYPRRPLRLIPVGQIEKDTPESKAFRQFALEKDMQIHLVPNPKQVGKASWERYERYQLAKTFREIIELSATSKNPKVRGEQIAKARADITNDFLRGYILFPQLEHNASAHYVDATKVARAFGTVNIHALFSNREMTLARQHAKLTEERTLSDHGAA